MARELLVGAAMARPPRFIPPGSMVELTARTHNATLLLRPSAELNQRILMILGRALLRHPVLLHAFAFLSNHWHALATAADAAQASQFMQYVNGNIAKAAQELHGWTAAVWGGRPRMIPVLDDGAAEDRLRYILAHGAKEGLVASPLDWPGVSCVAMLARGDRLVGIRRRLRRGTGNRPIEVVDEYPIVLTPLPSWAPLSEAQRLTRAQELVRGIETEARRIHPRPLGAEGVRRQDPTSLPQESKRSPAPLVHTASAALRAAFVQARKLFIDAFRAAVRRVATGPAAALAPLFPAGALMPRIPAPTGGRRAAHSSLSALTMVSDTARSADSVGAQGDARDPAGGAPRQRGAIGGGGVADGEADPGGGAAVEAEGAGQGDEVAAVEGGGLEREGGAAPAALDLVDDDVGPDPGGAVARDAHLQAIAGRERRGIDRDVAVAIADERHDQRAAALEAEALAGQLTIADGRGAGRAAHHEPEEQGRGGGGERAPAEEHARPRPPPGRWRR